MNLFQTGNFKLHSGQTSGFKIECDALKPRDIKTIAIWIKNKFIFGDVVGIPKGGYALAQELRQYQHSKSNTLLIVDDVITSGTSMEVHRNLYTDADGETGGPIIGVVVFSRCKCPNWIHPIFQMWE
jgi:orotate phosphoribosyltransferase